MNERLDELFCSIPDTETPSYHDHYWRGTELVYITSEGLKLYVQMSPDETTHTMVEKIDLAYEKALEQIEAEHREWEEISRYEEPGVFTYASESLRAANARANPGYVFELILCNNNIL